MSEHKNPKKIRKELKTPEVVQRSEEDIEKLKEAKVPTRRVRMLMVNPTDFMFLFTKGLKFRKNYKIIKGVPDDAQVIAVAPDSIRNGIMLVVQSSEFDEIPINVLPPTIPVDIDLDAVTKPTKKAKTDRKKKK